jgi:hypothetical protein
MITKKNRIRAFARGLAAQAWCTSSTEKIVMIPELAEAFAIIIEDLVSQSWLGNATTRELLAEIHKRIEKDGKLDYRTVDS